MHNYDVSILQMGPNYGGQSGKRERTYVPRVLCSPGPMFPGSHVPRVLCSPGPMFPGSHVPRVLCCGVGGGGGGGGLSRKYFHRCWHIVAYVGISWRMNMLTPIGISIGVPKGGGGGLSI